MSCAPRLLSRAAIAGPSRLAPLVLIARIAPRASPARIQAPPLPRSLRHATNLASTSSSPNPGLPPVPSQPSISVQPPSISAIKEEGYFEEDVQLVPPEEARLVITPAAIQQLALITSREPPDTISKGKLALRVGVESGGCHGYQYSMAITEERGVDDYVMQPEGINSIPVVIDLMSLGLMKGSTLDYATELIGSAFRIEKNPQAKDGGACGCGISWEAK